MTRRRRGLIYNKLNILVIPDNVSTDLIYELFKNVRYLDSGCWVRGLDSSVYTNVGGIRAHRVSYELFKDKKLQHLGCHHCDTPACINPDHIFDGTNKDNHNDAVKKNRKRNIQFLSKKEKALINKNHRESWEMRSYRPETIEQIINRPKE